MINLTCDKCNKVKPASQTLEAYSGDTVCEACQETLCQLCLDRPSEGESRHGEWLCQTCHESLEMSGRDYEGEYA